MTTYDPDAPDMRPLRERLASLSIDPSTPFEEATERLERAGLGDGLPLIPPTAERIDAMLGAQGLDPEVTLEMLMPSFVAPTLWDVAACAVIAGCDGRALPVLITALRAVGDPRYNLLGVQATTGAATPLLIVHGPAVEELGINAGTNAMGQGARANATIGRAFRLVLQDVGLALPGSGDMATHGTPGKYTWCVGEQAGSPWPPFHVTRGLDAGSSAVTVVAAVGSTEVVLGGSTPEEVVDLLGNVTVPTAGREVLILLPPESARLLDGAGWDRAMLQRALFERWRDRTTVRRAPQSSDDVLVVVTGGTGVKATYVPTWGGTEAAITRALDAT